MVEFTSRASTSTMPGSSEKNEPICLLDPVGDRVVKSVPLPYIDHPDEDMLFPCVNRGTLQGDINTPKASERG
jgi:hypothetical protein